VRRDPDLGDEHYVQHVPGLLHHAHDVAVHVRGVDSVDADRDRLAASLPVMMEQSRDHMLAGLLLVGGRDGVLEIEKDVVRLAVERLLEQDRLRAGDGELAALEPRVRRLVAGEAHALTGAREEGEGDKGGDWAGAARGATG